MPSDAVDLQAAMPAAVALDGGGANPGAPLPRHVLVSAQTPLPAIYHPPKIPQRSAAPKASAPSASAPASAPVSVSVAPSVVVLFAPLAEERKGAARLVHEIARAIAAGTPHGALCFDYFGTGEAPGAFEELTWERLLSDGRAALATAAALAAGDRSAEGATVYALGIRLGVRIALEALADAALAPVGRPGERPGGGLGGGLGGRLGGGLWIEPVLDGVRWWKDATRRSRFRLGGRPGGDLDLDGYRFHPDLHAALSARTAADPLPAIPARCILTAPGGTPTAQQTRVADRLAAAGGAPGVIAAPRIAPMPPFWLETDPFDAVPMTAVVLDALAELTV